VKPPPRLRAKFVSHLRANAAVALALLACSLAIGMAGYHWLRADGVDRRVF
jgi:F0F1-type ATP synthase membrane subunit c/vacuolar-type H+-ATPase subunit K